MFRNYNDENNFGGGGYINRGIDMSDESSSSANSSTTININRSKYDQQTLYHEMMYKKPQTTSFINRVSKKCSSSSSFTTRLKSIFPIISWLGGYKRDDLFGDFISGCTVAIMHIPQGMGYALLANLPPVVGIYMAFFPVLMYILFGTSKHNSMGTFAVVSIMVGKCVNKYANVPVALISQHSSSSSNGFGNLTAEAFTQQQPEIMYTPIEVATLVCFIVGVIQLLMFVLRLGILSSLLSECLVSGFTTGAAFHVLTSQVKDLLGLQLPRINGNFKLLKTYIEIFKAIDQVNQVAIILAVITIIILLFNNEILKPIVSKRTKIPIPIELIVVVGGTIIARFLHFDEQWNVTPVGHIPTGFPSPKIPNFTLWKELIFDCFAIAFVSYSVTVSMALIFGQKMKYEIDFNQELLAMGTGNIFGAFFSCLPFSASLSRSLIQQTVGGRTQLASIISCILLVFVLLWIGPFFEVLPRCILASVVVVALKGMLIQVFEFSQFKKKSIKDGIVWMVTFLVVVIVAIDIGLLVGIVMSLFCIIMNGMKPHACILGRIPGTDLFLDIERFEKAIEIPFVKIFHYGGSINFANKSSFRDILCRKLGINLIQEIQFSKRPDDLKSSGKASYISSLNFKYLILDFSALTSIDPSSITLLTSVIDDFIKLDIKVTMIGCSSRIYEAFINSDFSHMNLLFPTISDALIYLNV